VNESEKKMFRSIKTLRSINNGVVVRLRQQQQQIQQTRSFKLFRVNIAAKDDEGKDVWGLATKEYDEELSKINQMIASMLERSYLGPVKQQLASRGYEQDEFQQGCEQAYKKVAQVYGNGEPIFHSEHLDIVEENLAFQLDEQLHRFKKDLKVPKLNIQTVNATVLFFMRARKESMEGPLLVRLFNWFVSSRVPEVKPRYEVLAAVEYNVKESFHLAIPPTEGVPPDEPPPAEERKHFFVLAADEPSDITEGKEADVLEFKVRSMGRPFGL
jgi:hypothetical protein